jgi:lipopolysaccharide biosynthesis regulator YciM
LDESEGKLEDYVALGNALRSTGQLDQAAALLEQALLRFPSSPEVGKVLAHVYIDRGELSAAADLLYGTALLEPDLMSEAAELYRRSGQVYRALAINGSLSDQPEKLRQRLALLIEMQSFEQAAAMDDAMYRLGLLSDQDLAYAMAYAQFKAGAFKRSEELLTTLTRPELVRKAVELRRAMQDCGQVSWKCL